MSVEKDGRRRPAAASICRRGSSRSLPRRLEADAPRAPLERFELLELTSIFTDPLWDRRA